MVLALALLLLPLPGVAMAQKPSVPPSPKPCTNRTTPPKPVNDAERPPPGHRPPPAPEVADPPRGGEKMSGCRKVLPEGVGAPKSVRTASWLVADMDSGAVYAAKDPHGRHRPASLIKVLLALVVIDDLDPKKIVQATRADAKQECTCVGVRAHQKYSVHDLFTAMLMRSGNDTAHTLGTALGGQDVALKKMNAMAHRIGALDTHASSVSGLDAPGMMTSAYDMGLIFRWAMNQPTFAKAVRTTDMSFKTHRKKPPVTVSNDNQLLGRPGMKGYPGFLGGKTGYTDNARATYVGAAERGGKRLLVVLMRGESEPMTTSDQAKRLLNYGFRLAGRDTSAVGALDGKPHDADENKPARTTTPRPADDAPPPTTTQPNEITAGEPRRFEKAPSEDESQQARSATLLAVAAGVSGIAGVLLMRRRKR